MPCLLAGPWLASVATVMFKAEVGEENYGWLPFWLSSLILATFVICGACWCTAALYRFRWLTFGLLMLGVGGGSALAVDWLFSLPSWYLSHWIGALPVLLAGWGIAAPVFLLFVRRPWGVTSMALMVTWVLVAVAARLLNPEVTIWWLLAASLPMPSVLGTRALIGVGADHHPPGRREVGVR